MSYNFSKCDTIPVNCNMISVSSISLDGSLFGSIGSPVTTGTAQPCHGIATAPIEHGRFRVAAGPGRCHLEIRFCVSAFNTWIVLFSSCLMSTTCIFLFDEQQEWSQARDAYGASTMSGPEWLWLFWSESFGLCTMYLKCCWKMLDSGSGHLASCVRNFLCWNISFELLKK